VPRKKKVLPSYLLHKSSGQARVRIAGRDYLLGPYDSEQSRIKYGKLISELAGGLPVDPLAGCNRPQSATDAGLSVAALLLAFLRHAESYYIKNGEQTDEVACFKSAMRPVRELFALIPAKDFSPLNLKAVQQRYVALGWSRGFCNSSINRVRRIFKWGVGEGLIPVPTWQALQAIPPLKAGHTTAPDYKRREAVSDEHLEAVRPHLRREYRDLFDLLLATGARPSELLGLQMSDINTRDEVWIAELADHKNVNRGLSRKLFFGPQSQLILRRRPATGSLFPFHRQTFSNAVKRACKAAKIPPFVPYSLRHTKGTAVRDAIGDEAAQATLGHAKSDTTARYTRRMDKLAIEAAKACG